MPRQKTKAQRSIPTDPQSSRINKVLAAAGLGSRRQVEELVLQGRVEINGQTVTDLASRVDPQTAKIKVDGEFLKRPKLVYYALNKPKGILSTNHDPSGRPRVVDFVPDRHRVFSVGRLDQHSEGLMLLTNDGSLAQRLAHPRFRVQKTYFVVVAGTMTPEELERLRKGVYLAEGVARIDGARIRKTRKSCTELEILLSEGKNREIRRILARAGHKVVLLRRISIGPLRLGDLPVGAARELATREVQALYSCTLAPKKAKAASETSTKSKSTSGGKKPGGPSRSDEESSIKSRREVHSGYQTTPLELPAIDDFGLGLDDDFTGAETASQFDRSGDSVPQEFLFSEENLAAMDADSEWSEEEDWDDDFATGFSMAGRSGSVIGADEEPRRSQDSRAKQSRPSGRGRKVATSGTRSSSRDPRAQGSKRVLRAGVKRTTSSTRSARTPAKKGEAAHPSFSKSTGQSASKSKARGPQLKATKSGLRSPKGTQTKGLSGKRSSGKGSPGKNSSGRGSSSRNSSKRSGGPRR